VIEFPITHLDSIEKARFTMLEEKFFLVLEMLRSIASDGSVKVVSNAPHVPIKALPPK
jgi:hypothetical protein